LESGGSTIELAEGAAEIDELCRKHLSPPTPFAVARERLNRALGNPEANFLEAILVEIELACMQDGALDITSFNLVVLMVEAEKPRDHNEIMVSILKALLFRAATRSLHPPGKSDPVHHQHPPERQAKLATAFLKLTLGLKQYRTASETQITVQNFSITEGNKTIVSNLSPAVTQQQPAANLTHKDASASPALPDGRGMAMPLIDKHRVCTEIANENVPDSAIPTGRVSTDPKTPLTPDANEHTRRFVPKQFRVDK
jgi:hypothetical protein